MAWVSWSELRKREAAVLDSCAAQLLSRPLPEVTIKAVAESSGLPPWAAYGAIRRLARGRKHLLRRAVLHLASGLAEGFVQTPPLDRGVLAAIEGFVAHAARTMRADPYASLFRVVLCDGAYHPWLHELYEEKLAAAFCRGLEAAVEEASRGTGVTVLFPSGAVRNVLRRLEAALLLPGLLPGAGAGDADEAALVRDVAREAFGWTYAWDLGEAA